MDVRYFSKKVVEWYNQNKRNLPWRGTRDPYKIWLSEIILQQTRVNQGLPYYKKFVTEFPDVNTLASAPLQKVLRLWQGLGYYTRARNLHACARQVAKQHRGVFPKTYEELKRLPGIGEYTAAAIASIAYHEQVAVVDGNVYRVLSRIFGVEKPINSPEGKKHFLVLANKLISKHHPDTHNQAVMEFGALHCTPKNPQCGDCVFAGSCVANQHELQTVLPVKIDNKKTRRRYFYYFVIRKGNSLLMNHRNGQDIWKGLYDFYLIEKNRPSNPEKLMAEDHLLKKLKPVSSSVEVSGMYRHILSHQAIFSRFTVLTLSEYPKGFSGSLRFHSPEKVMELPKPVLISRFLHDFQLL